MAKFCGKCGSKLDPTTGLCPQCNEIASASMQHDPIPMDTDVASLTKNKRNEKKAKAAEMTFGQKAKRFFLRLFIWLLVWLILSAVITGGLVYFDIVDIPVVRDIVHKVEVVLHTEHKWQAATCTEPKTCEICKETEGLALGHSWMSATCVNPETCSVCGKIGSAATGHDWVAATCEEPKTCLVCKETQGSSLGHVWIEATCTSPKICAVCGKESGAMLEHQWREATYNEPRTCTICRKTEGKKKAPTSPLGLLDIVSKASASSVYSGDKLGKHVPENMYDGNLKTNWAENVSGNGVGEYVVFNFDKTYAVNKLRIYVGSHFNANVYKQNCRPKAITITFSDGSTEFVRLEDSYDEQIITFKQYYYTDSIKLTIEEVYTGTKYSDTVIAELDFVAYKP